MAASNEGFARRSRRVRHTLKRAANGRARLSVFRSSKHIYAQVIDDRAGKTVAAASTLDEGLKGSLPKGSDPLRPSSSVEAAATVLPARSSITCA